MWGGVSAWSVHKNAAATQSLLITAMPSEGEEEF